MNRPALIVGAALLIALAMITAVGEYVRQHLPGDDKLTRCRAIPPGSSLPEIEAVLGQPFARWISETVEGAVWLEFRTPSTAAGRIRAVVHEPTGKCSPFGAARTGPTRGRPRTRRPGPRAAPGHAVHRRRSAD